MASCPMALMAPLGGFTHVYLPILQTIQKSESLSDATHIFDLVW